MPAGTDKPEHDDTTEAPHDADQVATFVQQQLEAQDDPEDDAVDGDRADAFLARALAETQRMSKEVAKSNKKRDKVRNEFGNAKIKAWQREHEEMVLPGAQGGCVEGEAAPIAQSEAVQH